MERLPADILYEISKKLTSNNTTLQDKYDSTIQIINLCKTNKRFDRLYCQNDKIWQELWLQNINNNLHGYGKNKYIKILHDTKDSNIEDVLLFASKHDYLELARYCIQNGARIVQEDSDGEDEENALTIAIENGHLKMVNYLMQQEEMKNDNISLWYYLVIAAENGQFKIVDYFIQLGADIHEELDRIMPITAQAGQLEMFKYLRSLGGDIHAWYNQSLDPLLHPHWAMPS